jgi:hypothetical protein
MMDLSNRVIIGSIVKKAAEAESKGKFGNRFRITTLGEIETIMSAEEVGWLKAFFSQSPKTFGFNGPYLGSVETPSDLVEIPPNWVGRGKRIREIPTQFVPAEAYQAFADMNG